MKIQNFDFDRRISLGDFLNKRKDDDLERGISDTWTLKAMFFDDTMKKRVEAGEEKEKSYFGKKCANSQ